MNKNLLSIEEIKTIYEIEGMELSQKDIDALNRVREGKTTTEEEVSKIIEEFNPNEN